MNSGKKHAVTGAYGFTGKHITHRLLAEGHKVITLTGNPNRDDPFDGKVRTNPFHFDNKTALAETLEGVDTLFNTYWVRFNYGKTTFDRAIENSLTLIEAAQSAGVRRLVHVSISNPDKSSPLPYFRGKAQVEAAMRASGISHVIVRPAVIFGDDGILINNIAWALRRFPLFPIAGDGEYKLQPIYVGDLAALMVAAGKRTENEIIEAIGPETFAYKQMVRMIADTLGIKLRALHLPPVLVYAGAAVLGLFVGDKFLTWDELKGLMANTLYTASATAAGETKLSEWVHTHREVLGRKYANELKAHFRD